MKKILLIVLIGTAVCGPHLKSFLKKFFYYYTHRFKSKKFKSLIGQLKKAMQVIYGFVILSLNKVIPVPEEDKLSLCS